MLTSMLKTKKPGLARLFQKKQNQENANYFFSGAGCVAGASAAGGGSAEG